MNDRKKTVLNMFIRVVKHMGDHPVLPAIAQATAYVTQITNAKTVMQSAGSVKDEANGEFRAAASSRRFIVSELRTQLREIAETAKSLNRTGAMPGIHLKFRMPGGTMQDLRDRAAAFVIAAEPIKQAFIDHDSAATFVEDLEDAIEAFDDATDRRYAGLGTQVGATANLEATARAGIIAVRGLNAIMIKRYRSNPTLLAEWQAAQRIAGWPSAPTEPEPEPAPLGGENPPPSGS